MRQVVVLMIDMADAVCRTSRTTSTGRSQPCWLSACSTTSSEFVGVHVWICLCARVDVCVCVHASVCEYVRVCVRMCVCACMWMHVNLSLFLKFRSRSVQVDC